MKLATITNWAYGATVILSLAAGATMLLASNAQDHERAAVAQRYELDEVSSRVDKEEQLLSDQARQYVITGGAADLANYTRQQARLGPAEVRLRRVRDRGAGPDELSALKEGIEVIDSLQDEQRGCGGAPARRPGQGHEPGL